MICCPALLGNWSKANHKNDMVNSLCLLSSFPSRQRQRQLSHRIHQKSNRRRFSKHKRLFRAVGLYGGKHSSIRHDGKMLLNFVVWQWARVKTNIVRDYQAFLDDPLKINELVSSSSVKLSNLPIAVINQTDSQTQEYPRRDLPNV